MTRNTHRILLCTFGALALGVGFSGLAWACTQQAYIDPIKSISSSGGKGGSTITVTGWRFIPGPVQIHLNSESGPILATATGPNFTTTVKLPKVQPGVYFVYATAKQSDGTKFTPNPKKFMAKAAAAPRRQTAARAPAPKPDPGRNERPQASAERSSPSRSHPSLSKSDATPPATAPATTAATAGASSAVTPVVVSSQPTSAAPAKAPAPAKRPVKTNGASVPAPPQPTAITPLVTSLRSPWSDQPSAGPDFAAASASAKSSDGIPSLGLGLLVLGLAVLGGAAFALLRARPRPPVTKATVTLPLPTAPAPGTGAMPVAVPPSLEEELEELIAESAAREEPAEPAVSEELAPREPAGAPR